MIQRRQDAPLGSSGNKGAPRYVALGVGAASQQGGDLLFPLVFKDTKVLFLIHTRVHAKMERGKKGEGDTEWEREENWDPANPATSLSWHLERLTNFTLL